MVNGGFEFLNAVKITFLCNDVDFFSTCNNKVTCSDFGNSDIPFEQDLTLSEIICTSSLLILSKCLRNETSKFETDSPSFPLKDGILVSDFFDCSKILNASMSCPILTSLRKLDCNLVRSDSLISSDDWIVFVSLV